MAEFSSSVEYLDANSQETSEWVGIATTLWMRIQEVIGSNLGRGYPD
jgi:hypothetical protein